jgi:hypothetical protein
VDLPKPRGWTFVLRFFKTLEVLLFKLFEILDFYRAQKSIVGVPGLVMPNYTSLQAVVYNGTQEEVLGYKPRRLLNWILRGIPDLELFEQVNFQVALNEHSLRTAQGNTETRGFVQLQLPWQLPWRSPRMAWMRMQPVGVKTLVGTIRLGDYEILSAPVFFLNDEVKRIVISDIDDTIKDTRITENVNFQRIVSGLFKGHYYKYEAIEGMAELYQSMASKDTLFIYLTSTPYALAPFLLKFLREKGFPDGPVFLRWLGYGRFGHKWRSLHRILSNVEKQKCLLIGDSGEMDLQIYRRVCSTPQIGEKVDRVLIRHVPGTPRQKTLSEREAYYNDLDELKAILQPWIREDVDSEKL